MGGGVVGRRALAGACEVKHQQADGRHLNWRPMTAKDLTAVDAIAARVHPLYPEEQAVLAERLRLYPDGCRALDMALDMGGAGIAGYVLSHPWHLGEPPALNVMLERIPSPGSTYYIHDLALLPEARGSGAGFLIVNELISHARELGLPSLSLVAVNGSMPFWERHGFEAATVQHESSKPSSYGEDARLMSLDLA